MAIEHIVIIVKENHTFDNYWHIAGRGWPNPRPCGKSAPGRSTSRSLDVDAAGRRRALSCAIYER